MISSIYIRDKHFQDVKYLCRILDVSLINSDGILCGGNYDIEGRRSSVDRVLKYVQYLAKFVKKKKENEKKIRYGRLKKM